MRQTRANRYTPHLLGLSFWNMTWNSHVLLLFLFFLRTAFCWDPWTPESQPGRIIESSMPAEISPIASPGLAEDRALETMLSTSPSTPEVEASLFVRFKKLFFCVRLKNSGQ